MKDANSNGSSLNILVLCVAGIAAMVAAHFIFSPLLFIAVRVWR